MEQKKLEQTIFQSLVNDFLYERKSRNRSKNTIRFYSDELRYFSNWLESNNIKIKDVIDISPSLLRRYFLSVGERRTKGGIHASFRAIKAFINFIDDELEPTWKNPIKKVKIQSNIQPQIEGISIEDIQKMINACTGRNKIRDIAILKTLLDTGCRAQELLDLNICDVDLGSGSVKVKHGKGDKFRIVYLGINARKSLKEYLATREVLLPNAALFLNDDGLRLKYYGLRMIISRLAHKTGTKEGVHNFRRCCALSLHRKKVDILTISRYLGHGSIEITKRYLSINDEDIKNALANFSPTNNLD